jgi:hypothetical protein
LNTEIVELGKKIENLKEVLVQKDLEILKQREDYKSKEDNLIKYNMA